MHGENGWQLHEGLAAVGRLTARANEFTAATAPWTVAKDESRRAELEVILASLIRRIARQTVLLVPFMPEKSAQLWRMLGAPGEVSAQRFDQLESLDVSAWQVRKGDPLFPRPQPQPTAS